MTKTMTIDEILSVYESLSDFIKKDIAMPAGLSWVISDNFDELQKHVIKFQQKKESIGQQFIRDGKTIKNKDGSESVTSEHMPEYRAKIQEILSIERPVAIESISKSSLLQIDNLSVLDIKTLGYMISKEAD